MLLRYNLTFFQNDRRRKDGKMGIVPERLLSLMDKTKGYPLFVKYQPDARLGSFMQRLTPLIFVAGTPPFNWTSPAIATSPTRRLSIEVNRRPMRIPNTMRARSRQQAGDERSSSSRDISESVRDRQPRMEVTIFSGVSPLPSVGRGEGPHLGRGNHHDHCHHRRTLFGGRVRAPPE